MAGISFKHHNDFHDSKCHTVFFSQRIGGSGFDLKIPVIIILITVFIRFFTAQFATRMSYLASKTVKQKMRELIYRKLLKLGSKYREQVTTAELVQESVEGVDQLESYFGLYVPLICVIWKAT